MPDLIGLYSPTSLAVRFSSLLVVGITKEIMIPKPLLLKLISRRLDLQSERIWPAILIGKAGMCYHTMELLSLLSSLVGPKNTLLGTGKGGFQSFLSVPLKLLALCLSAEF